MLDVRLVDCLEKNTNIASICLQSKLFSPCRKYPIQKAKKGVNVHAWKQWPFSVMSQIRHNSPAQGYCPSFTTKTIVGVKNCTPQSVVCKTGCACGVT